MSTENLNEQESRGMAFLDRLKAEGVSLKSMATLKELSFNISAYYEIRPYDLIFSETLIIVERVECPSAPGKVGGIEGFCLQDMRRKVIPITEYESIDTQAIKTLGLLVRGVPSHRHVYLRAALTDIGKAVTPKVVFAK